MHTRAEQKGLSFTITYLSEVPACVCGDARRSRQVLMNLLDNAIKYTEHGGVALKVDLLEGRVRFMVEDTGIGIRPEHLGEIFEVFQQVRDRRTVVEGTGLGLAISKRFVHLMGGELHVASTFGEGSRFWFDLDLPPTVAPTYSAGNRRLIGIRGDRRRVLVIDDDSDSRGLLHDLLFPLGFEVYEAADGQEGLDQARRLKPDAILMDMRMPRLDGLEATRQIRAMEKIKDTIIIAISASAFEHNRERCLEVGANDFLPKPFRREKLLDLLSAHLGLKLVHAVDGERASPHRQPSPELIVPPAEQLQTLLDLARCGDINNLLQQAGDLEALGEGYSPFAVQLRILAETYQMKKLRHWLKGLEGAP